MADIGIVDMLGLCGFNMKSKAKIVRHKDSKYPVQELLRQGWLEIYQGYQGKPRFDDIDYVVSMYGLKGTRAGFFGLFKKVGRKPVNDGPIPPDCKWVNEWRKKCNYFYELERVRGFESLERRLVVDWGEGALQWCQRLRNKPVLELLPAGRLLQPFDDYLEFSLTYQQLIDLFSNEAAHRDWKSPLEAVAGIYLILAETTGHQYVGSAYGASGVWGRWTSYATTGHGNNKKLVKLLEDDPNYPHRFRFSLLQILPKSMTKEEVIARESLYKRKLGTKATGLNSN